MPDDFEWPIGTVSFGDSRVWEEIVGDAVFDDFDIFVNTVELELFAEVLGGGDDEVGRVGMIDHEGPHFGGGESLSEVIIGADFDFVREIEGMKSI